MIIDTKGLEIGKKIYYIDIPTEKTVMCENLDSDDNFDESGNCKKDCYKDCCLPQATVKKDYIGDVVIEISGEGISLTINGHLEEKDVFFDKADAEKKLEVIRAEAKRGDNCGNQGN